MSSTWATIAITAIRRASPRWTSRPRRMLRSAARIWRYAILAGYCSSLHSENVQKLVLYAPLYNFNDDTNLGPGSALQNKRKPREFNFALGAYRVASEAANTGRWNGEIPVDNKDEYRDAALPAEFWKECMATDPTSNTRNPPSLRRMVSWKIPSIRRQAARYGTPETS